MAFRIKQRLEVAKDVARVPFDTVWVIAGAAAIMTAVLVVTGYVFLKDGKNPFYKTKNPEPLFEPKDNGRLPDP